MLRIESFGSNECFNLLANGCKGKSVCLSLTVSWFDIKVTDFSLVPVWLRWIFITSIYNKDPLSQAVKSFPQLQFSI